MCDGNCYSCENDTCVHLGADNTVATREDQARDDAMDMLSSLYNEAVAARDWAGAQEAMVLIKAVTADRKRLSRALEGCEAAGVGAGWVKW